MKFVSFDDVLKRHWGLAQLMTHVIRKTVLISNWTPYIQGLRLYPWQTVSKMELHIYVSVCSAYLYEKLRGARRLTFTVWYSKTKQGVQLWLYFNFFRKSDVWQNINNAILFFFLQKSPLLGYKCVSI